ncbi:Acyl-CoA synthetase (AMP-forming)/AMP-acid ligase II [Pedobacter steynii]|uniref:Acyl-CoA synthetase (AMP-forming)/AMP-acid ligase II n=1 Tax=Pedobacter steynii TaxID=430522 RepID=A0A1H0KNA5_9SPHI|nr:AMP-binding protein [Pedobacter steynii]NQX43338.1 AMP-binding protein [Pedobacter steynii]SDO57409.1 Acyl-CoA synthetase (AMP-forming)/AMP-acid ligase II [Pedobacter steynii]
MLKAIRLLKKAKLFSVKGIFYLLKALFKRGVNLMAILRLGAWLYPERLALVHEKDSFTYLQLYHLVKNLAIRLKENHQIEKGNKIAIVCANHPAFISSLFAAAYLGTDVYLLNSEMGTAQLTRQVKQHQFDFIIYDASFLPLILEMGYENRSLAADGEGESTVSRYLKDAAHLRSGKKLKRSSFNRVVILTSGTTGLYKSAARKASVSAYTGLFLSLLDRLKFENYQSVYVATPIAHGFGLAALCFSYLMGKDVYIRTGFDHKAACALIREEQIESVTLVPVMLRRMLEEHKEALQSLKCIISGGAVLSPVLAGDAMLNLGNKLYNLYGTSEAGVCLLAGPEDLKKYPGTIGKPLDGVSLQIREGQLWLKCAWSAEKDQWISTGDMGYQDGAGYYYLLGRSDDMIVSGGENVYPYELELLLMQHPLIKEVLVTGVEDETFGQRLAAFVVLHDREQLTKEEILSWLSGKAARYQMPKHLVFTEAIPLTPMGKPDRKVARLWLDQEVRD